MVKPFAGPLLNIRPDFLDINHYKITYPPPAASPAPSIKSSSPDLVSVPPPAKKRRLNSETPRDVIDLEDDARVEPSSAPPEVIDVAPSPLPATAPPVVIEVEDEDPSDVPRETTVSQELAVAEEAIRVDEHHRVPVLSLADSVPAAPVNGLMRACFPCNSDSCIIDAHAATC
jgi:hypothetical protein